MSCSFPHARNPRFFGFPGFPHKLVPDTLLQFGERTLETVDIDFESAYMVVAILQQIVDLVAFNGMPMSRTPSSRRPVESLLQFHPSRKTSPPYPLWTYPVFWISASGEDLPITLQVAVAWTNASERRMFPLLSPQITRRAGEHRLQLYTHPASISERRPTTLRVVTPGRSVFILRCIYA